MVDPIDRQAVLSLPRDTEKTLSGEIIAQYINVADIEKLPSVQPEIIHCKECKYGVQDEDKRWYCRGLGCQIGEADGSGFCADAERRTKDEDTL